MHDALHNDVVNRAGQVNVGRNIQSRDKTKFPAPANDHPPQHRHQHHYYYCNMMMSIYPVNVVFMISFSLPHHHATCYRHPLLLQNRHFFVYFLFTFCWQVKKKWRGEREGKKKKRKIIWLTRLWLLKYTEPMRVFVCFDRKKSFLSWSFPSPHPSRLFHSPALRLLCVSPL